MNRLDRLTAILVQLQSKRIVKAKEIAERFQISLRTVYRDVRALEEAGIPIGSDAGKGYYLAEGYHLPPMEFTREETSALITAGKLMAEFSGTVLKKHFDSALFKIKAILKTTEKDYLEDLENTIEVYQAPGGDERFGADFLADIQLALGRNNLIAMEYYAAKAQTTSRKVEPISLVFYDSRWYLIGFCRLRNAYRNFRVDRIIKLAVANEVFDRKRHGSLQKIFSDLRATVQLREVKFRIAKDVSDNPLKNKYGYGVAAQKDLGDQVEVTMLVDSLQVLGKWLVHSGAEVEIIHPGELKTVIRQYAGTIAKKYLR